MKSAPGVCDVMAAAVLSVSNSKYDPVFFVQSFPFLLTDVFVLSRKMSKFIFRHYVLLQLRLLLKCTSSKYGFYLNVLHLSMAST